MDYSTVIRISCAVMLSGCWFRSLCQVTGTFWPVLFGSTWLSFAQPFYLSAVGLFVTKWFPKNETAIATTICGLALPCGNLVAFTMTGLAFSGDNMSTKDYPLVINSLNSLLLQENILVTIVCSAFAILVKSEPNHPPSLAAMQ
jgi:hypothetical protein